MVARSLILLLAIAIASAKVTIVPATDAAISLGRQQVAQPFCKAKTAGLGRYFLSTVTDFALSESIENFVAFACNPKRTKDKEELGLLLSEIKGLEDSIDDIGQEREAVWYRPETWKKLHVKNAGRECKKLSIQLLWCKLKARLRELRLACAQPKGQRLVKSLVALLFFLYTPGLRAQGISWVDAKTLEPVPASTRVLHWAWLVTRSAVVDVWMDANKEPKDQRAIKQLFLPLTFVLMTSVADLGLLLTDESRRGLLDRLLDNKFVLDEE